MESTFVSSIGAYVTRFEQDVASYCTTQKGVALVNGTSALHTALNVVGVQAGDEVITQSLTFVATANAITYCKAEPVFIDVDINTMGLCPIALHDFLDEHAELRENECFNKKTGKKIAACVPMHTYGFPAEIDKLCELCSQWNIPVIEDAAEALGSTFKGKALGSFGDLGVLSFNGNKIITSGGGGAIITDNMEYALKAKHLSTTAKVAHSYEFYHDEIGYNYRMPNINAALLCAQLEQMDEFLLNKRELAEDYRAFFDKIGVKFRWEPNNSRSNFWLMCIELDSKNDRDLFLNAANNEQIMARPIWQLMHKLPMFAHCFRDNQKNSTYLEDRIVNIPSSYRPNGK